MRSLFPCIFVAASGCSLLVDFEADRLYCSEDGECASGFSCVGEVCVEDGSIGLDTSCTDQIQCEAGLSCAKFPFSCRPDCDNVFGDDDDCGDSRACAPVELVAKDGAQRGICEAAEPACAGDSDDCGLSPGGRQLSCVALDDAIERCLLPCSYTCDTSCTHACGLDGEVTLNCQPIVDNTRAVCVAEGDVGHRGDCDLAELRCQQGFVCIKGVGQSVGKCLKTCGTADDCGLYPDASGNPTTCGAIGTVVSVCGTL